MHYRHHISVEAKTRMYSAEIQQTFSRNEIFFYCPIHYLLLYALSMGSGMFFCLFFPGEYL